MPMKNMKFLIFPAIAVLLFGSCNSTSFDNSCIEFGKIVALMKQKLASAEENNYYKFSRIVHSENDEIKQMAFDNFKTLHALCRTIDERVVEKVYDEKTKDSNQIYNGVRMINKLFRDDWKKEGSKMIRIKDSDDYDGSLVHFSNIKTTFLVVCVDGQIKFDLDSQFEDAESALRWYRLLATKESRRNEELLKAITDQNVQNWNEFTEVMRMKDWSVRLDVSEIMK